jgi:hypothetical protein
MYVVLSDEFGDQPDPASVGMATLEQAFALIVCRCGYAYHFEPTDECWRLVLTDIERPSHSPDPVISTYKKIADAKHDLLAQAVDGRLKGYVALPSAEFERRRGDVMAVVEAGCTHAVV